MSFPQPPRNHRTGNTMRESIMIYGDSDQGKSHLFLTIAKWYQNLGSDARFHTINTDRSTEVLLENEEFEDLANVDVYEVGSMAETVNLMKKLNPTVRRNHDWVSMDLYGEGWKWAQDEYAAAQAKRLGGDIDDLGDLWLVENPGGDKHPIEGWEWGPINVRYRTLANNLFVMCPAHLFLVCGEKDLPKESSSGDSEDMGRKRGTFKHVGKVPVCQKDDPYRYNTILHVEKVRADPPQQGLITAKEKSQKRRRMGKAMGRATQWRHEPIDDFVMDYLVGVGGWTIS